MPFSPPIYIFNFRSFDPATLSLTGWWRGSFASSPWAGTASAGGSGARDLTEATNPPAVGTAQNGYDPADYDGTNDLIGSASELSVFVNDTTGSCWVLFRADTAAVSAGATVRVEDPGIISQDGGGVVWAITYSTSGVCALIYDVVYQEIVIAAATGSYHLAQMKWDGTDLFFRLNSGSWQSIACTGLLTGNTGALVTGKNYGASHFDGRILDMGITDIVLTDTEFDNVKLYINSRYGLSL